MIQLKTPYSRYAVTDNGEVYSLIKKDPFKMKTFFDKDGYLRVTLSDDDQKKKQCIVPRLMHEALVGPIPKDNVIRHIDGDTANNHISNLTIGTVLQNNHDKQRHGTQCAGETHGRAKLTNLEVLLIREDQRANRIIAKEYFVSDVLIGAIKKRKIWKHI